MHLIKHAECARNMQENGRGPERIDVSRPSSRSLTSLTLPPKTKKFLARALRWRKILSSTYGQVYEEEIFR